MIWQALELQSITFVTLWGALEIQHIVYVTLWVALELQSSIFVTLWGPLKFQSIVYASKINGLAALNGSKCCIYNTNGWISGNLSSGRVGRLQIPPPESFLGGKKK